MLESEWVVEVGEADFQSRVVDGSHERLVLVDFWAPWCGPCQSLAPVLELIADQGAGALLLAKVNTDVEQSLATQFGIRSLPTVKLFKAGREVAEFMGAQPESAIRALIAEHLPRPSDSVIEEAERLLGSGQWLAACEALTAERDADPANERIPPLLADCLIRLGRVDDAEKLLDGLSPARSQDRDVHAVRARLEFSRQVPDGVEPEDLRRAVESDPANCEARLQLGSRQILDEDYDCAVEQFIEIMRRDRNFKDDAGRRSLLATFDMLGADDPRISGYRARMAAALY